jgi:hypothetical protein
VIMQTTCRRQKPRRMSHQPNEMKTVLMALSNALSAGRSETVMAKPEKVAQASQLGEPNAQAGSSRYQKYHRSSRNH